MENFDLETEKIKFPQCNEILRTRSKESFLKDLQRMRRRIDDFKYDDHDDLNDTREDYIQFISIYKMHIYGKNANSFPKAFHPSMRFINYVQFNPSKIHHFA